MTQKLGNGFEFKKKACFVCGSLNHLIKDCNFYENKMVGKYVSNNKGKATGQREVRPVWNNAQRVNHQNKLTHPHPRRNFVPSAVITNSGKVPVNTAKQSFSRVAVSNSTARDVNIVASRPTVNGKVNTAKVNNVTTAGPKAVVSAAEGNGENDVKSSTCWIWRPTRNVIDHISKDSGSYTPKRFDYVDPQGRINRFSWVFFLATKDETPEILKNFITGIENQIDHKVKAIKCDNGTEFKNRIMNEFCEMKGIRREFSVARTPQQNGVAERKNRTLIEAARTMLADSKLPTTFWAEAVNTACYVQNRVPKSLEDEVVDDARKKNEVLDPTKEGDMNGQGEAADTNSTNRLNTLEDIADLQDTGIFSGAYDDEDVGAEAGLNNLSKLGRGNARGVTPVYIAEGYTQEEGIEYDEVFAPVARIEAIKLFLAYASFMGFIVYQMDVKRAFLYDIIEEEVYVCRPPGFEDLQFPNKKFDFSSVKTASTLIKTNKALLKDEEAEDVDVHLYRSMIRSLIDSSFDLEAFSDSNYAGASLDRKSTIGGVMDSNQMLDYGFNFMNTKNYIDNESTIFIIKNPVFHSKTKHIEIRHHLIRDSYEKKLIQLIKIYTDHNVADLSQWLLMLVEPITVLSSCQLKKTHKPRKAKRSTEISKCSGPTQLVIDETIYKECEDKMERASTTASSLEAEQDSEAQTRFEVASKSSNDPPLSRVNTLRSGEDNMKPKGIDGTCCLLVSTFYSWVVHKYESS
ncbi:putative ribonuclease H-like domain-containing protein [Tanacetum coccineum]